MRIDAFGLDSSLLGGLHKTPKVVCNPCMQQQQPPKVFPYPSRPCCRFACTSSSWPSPKRRPQPQQPMLARTAGSSSAGGGPILRLPTREGWPMWPRTAGSPASCERSSAGGGGNRGRWSWRKMKKREQNPGRDSDRKKTEE